MSQGSMNAASLMLGLSESARVTTRAESSYRVQYPNSLPRSSRIIALDDASLHELNNLEGDWANVRVLMYRRTLPLSDALQMVTLDAELEDNSGAKVLMSEELADADVIVMVASAGSDSSAAEVVANAAYVRNRLATGLVLTDGKASSEDLAFTLTAMRPYARMLVVSAGDGYVEAMLTALRA